MVPSQRKAEQGPRKETLPKHPASTRHWGPAHVYVHAARVSVCPCCLCVRAARDAHASVLPTRAQQALACCKPQTRSIHSPPWGRSQPPRGMQEGRPVATQEEKARGKTQPVDFPGSLPRVIAPTARSGLEEAIAFVPAHQSGEVEAQVGPALARGNRQSAERQPSLRYCAVVKPLWALRRGANSCASGREHAPRGLPPSGLTAAKTWNSRKAARDLQETPRCPPPALCGQPLGSSERLAGTGTGSAESPG